MKIQLAPIAALLSTLFFSIGAQAASEQDLQNSFDPYAKGFDKPVAGSVIVQPLERVKAVKLPDHAANPHASDKSGHASEEENKPVLSKAEQAKLDRAKAAGFDTLVLTVDVPVAGARLRDVRNGMTIPPSLTSKTILNAIPRPAWWLNFLTTDPLKFASLDAWNGTVAELLDSMFDPTVTFEDLKWIRKNWKGKLVVKGIQNVDDAVKSVSAGADAIILSNHGGRQLDRAPVPFLLLPEVRKKIGKKAELHMDTGIMHGADIVAALANGANFTWIGRAYLYGLMAGGRDGVDRSIEILSTQVYRTMKLLGVKSVSELNHSHVRTINRFAK